MFPTDLPDYTPFTTPITLRDMAHAERHQQYELDITAVATKVGVTGSADTTSLDYKVSNVVSGLASHIANTSNPHSTTKAQVGLGNVDNFSLLQILATVYPVGAIYASTVSTNPGTVFGFGTWAAYAAGRVMVGVGTSDQAFTAAATGGESTHVLTTSEMPAHTHSVPSGALTKPQGTGGNNAASIDPTTSGSTGSGSAHNNLQPYIVTYFFQRTA